MLLGIEDAHVGHGLAVHGAGRRALGNAAVDGESLAGPAVAALLHHALSPVRGHSSDHVL